MIPLSSHTIFYNSPIWLIGSPKYLIIRQIVSDNGTINKYITVTVIANIEINIFFLEIRKAQPNSASITIQTRIFHGFPQIFLLFGAIKSY